jgi:tRNA/tmRNA/rRNA uracil-C5-methylase (TrmA/RlmC/RlmD family)
MRARLHVRGGKVGFFREGTHQLCDAAATGQLMPETGMMLRQLSSRLAAGSGGLRAWLTSIDLAENLAGDERVVHFSIEEGRDPESLSELAATPGLTGATCSAGDARRAVVLRGSPFVSDTLPSPFGAGRELRLRRRARAFFQANRYLLPLLVERVCSLVPAGAVADLYAGVGLFGLSLAAAGRDDVTLVEGDPVSAADLEVNARPFAGSVRLENLSVERFLAQGLVPARGSVVVDPPRTGMSREAIEAILAAAPATVVYVSCDTATLARDVGRFLEAGYGIAHVEAFDMFPNTAHVESVAVLVAG